MKMATLVARLAHVFIGCVVLRPRRSMVRRPLPPKISDNGNSLRPTADARLHRDQVETTHALHYRHDYCNNVNGEAAGLG